MRAAMETRGAYVFKTIGDAFCAAFATAPDATAAALDAQRALAREDFSAVEGLRVRMALHAGSADEREGDYFGPTVNRVARLLATGHGGQVLLSGACAELLQAELPPECSLRESRRAPAQGPRAARTHPPAARTRPDRRLPATAFARTPLEQLTSTAQLVYRVARREIAEITALVERHRLVTLVGSGGVGKTRLSCKSAADLIDDLSDGVWFVELAPLSKGEYIPTTVASAELSIRSRPKAIRSTTSRARSKENSCC